MAVIMVAMSDAARVTSGEFSAAAALRTLGQTGAVGAGIVGVHLVWGIGVPCPMLHLTGWQCPLCGSTRAAEALLRFDPASAWVLNPLFVVGMVILGVCAVAWAIEVLGGPALRLPTSWPRATQQRVYLISAVVAVAFTLVRNLV